MSTAQMFSLTQARARLGELIDRAALGEEIVITRRGKAAALLRSARAPKRAIPSMAEFRAEMPLMKTSSADLIRRVRDEGA